MYIFFFCIKIGRNPVATEVFNIIQILKLIGNNDNKDIVMIPETNFIVIILIILYTRNYSSGLITVKTLFSRGQK